MQYWSLASGYAPHLGQRMTLATSCTPQCMQNWSMPPTGLWHCGQFAFECRGGIDIAGINGGCGTAVGVGIGRDVPMPGSGGGNALMNAWAFANLFSSRAYARLKTSSRYFGTAGLISLGRSVPAGRSPVSIS